MELSSHGYLELLIGPMFAGKSTELIRLARLYSILGKSIVTVNHSLNYRYNTKEITTHDQVRLKSQCIAKNLHDKI